MRIIENITGVAPLSQFDTFATPMVASFGPEANLEDDD
jgi:hypothetical protein